MTPLNIEHPSAFLNNDLVNIIRTGAYDAERAGMLHANQLKVIYEQQWFKMFVPSRYGGLGLSLPEILKIEEALSWADGSTAWVVTLCSGAGWFIGFLNEKIIPEFFGTDTMCIAGSSAITGIAKKTNQGYVIEGLWKYASGALHATAFTVNCHIAEGDKLLYNSNGSPLVRSFILKPDEVCIKTTWHPMGMIATGSHSFEVTDLLVPIERCFHIDAPHAVLKDMVYQFPFLQLAETTLAVNMSGMGVKFLELCQSLLTGKTKGGTVLSADTLKLLNDNRVKLHKLRETFYHIISNAWKDLLSQGKISDSACIDISKASQSLAHCARQAVNDLYPHCGLSAADMQSEINRVWRNIHTAGQHALFVKE